MCASPVSAPLLSRPIADIEAATETEHDGPAAILIALPRDARHNAAIEAWGAPVSGAAVRLCEFYWEVRAKMQYGRHLPMAGQD